jgi:hypothetical protein
VIGLPLDETIDLLGEAAQHFGEAAAELDSEPRPDSEPTELDSEPALDGKPKLEGSD